MHSASLKAFGALVATMVVASPALAQRMERGAFLRKPAKSRAQLLAQLKSDPIVAARYARHLGMTQSQLEQYFGTLRGSTVPSSRRYLVWHVNPDGTIGNKNLVLKAGTHVFVDKHGRIVLKESCGNPMVSGDYARRDVTEAKPPILPAEEVALVPSPPETLPVSPDIVPPVEVPPVIDTPPVAPPVIIDTAPAAPVTTMLAPPPIVPIATGGGGGLGWLPWLAVPIIGGVTLGGGHGHGGGGHTPPPVPEPTSIVALTAGVGLVLARRRKKRD